MNSELIPPAIERLKLAAEAFRQGIRSANQLPDSYSTLHMEAITSQLLSVSGTTPDDLRTVLHLHDKLLQSVGDYPLDADVGAHDYLRRLHGELFIETSRYLREAPATAVQEVTPHSDRGLLVSQSLDQKRLNDELFKKVSATILSAQRADIVINQSITNNSFNVIQLNDLKVALTGIRKACMSISVELSAKLLDLPWLSEFIEWIAKCQKKLADIFRHLGKTFSTSEAGKAVTATLQSSMGVVHGIGELILSSIAPAKPSASASTEDTESILKDRIREQERALAHRVVELERMQGQLEHQGQRLRELASTLVSAREEAELANRNKSDFLANMSHELRSPLNAVIGMAEIIGNEMHGPIGDDRYKEYVRHINDSGKYLLNIVNDLHDLSNIEAGKFSLKEEVFSIGEVIEEAMTLVDASIKKAKLAVKWDKAGKDLKIFADRRCIRRVLVNVIANSVAATPASGRISISHQLQADAALRMVIADTGIGMTAHQIDDIAKTPQYRARGAGLGLPLSFAVVTAHSGKLLIESDVGVGTSVTVIIPSSRVRSA